MRVSEPDNVSDIKSQGESRGRDCTCREKCLIN